MKAIIAYSYSLLLNTTFVTSSTILWLEILIKYIKYETIKAVFNVRNISQQNGKLILETKRLLIDC